ncbi:MAG TPA: universal stress protein [Solirubrobacterales bacterium]|nr:universal stress protein [Solirubrobacterales bacterium]
MPLAGRGMPLVNGPLALLGAIHLEHVLILCALILGLAGGFALAKSRLGGRSRADAVEVHHILLPFTGTEISRRAVDAALRLAKAEGATLMPAYLAEVPKTLPLDCSIPNEAAQAMAMLEAIEQRATAKDVPVDARIERGRTYRHALARLLGEERFDRVVVSAGATGTHGLSGDDLVWLLEKAPTEVMILRPGPEDHRLVVAAGSGRVAMARSE